jgi:cell division cycle 20-like protein 1, cofactor of APC complex
MDTSLDMICNDALVVRGEHATPKAIRPSSNAAALTPNTLASTDGSNSSTSSSPLSSPDMLRTTHRTIRFPLPSPSRPRLDPRYAARLPHIDLSAPVADAMDPPLVRRCEEHTGTSLFHPTPIITPGGGDVKHDPTYERFHTTSLDASLNTPPKRTRPAVSDYRGASAMHQDRFIPSRISSNFRTWQLWEEMAESTPSCYSSHFELDMSHNTSSSNVDTSTRSTSDATTIDASGGATVVAAADATAAPQNLLAALLRTGVLGENVDPLFGGGGGGGLASSSPRTNHFRFSSAPRYLQESVSDPASVVNAFSLTPMNDISERLIATPNKRKRRISKVPFKVLDAPALQDDFYLNLVDWSSHNVLAVGLGACVYLWSACTSKVTKLCDLSVNEDTVTGVSWAQRGTHLAVGTNKGEVQLWDTVKCKKVRSMTGHTARVGTLAWTGPILASGSRDRLIYLRDVRLQSPFTDKLANHRQEVCGLKWSFEEPSFLASGGNDNNLYVFDSRNPCEPLHKFSEHTAAVKAIAWSPHQHGLLASGGGTADRCIRFYNTVSGTSLNKIDTGSQVCNLAWSQNCNEIVSTHGYSLNQIVVWRYPSMSKVATLTGHTFRVLYLAMSPDGSTVVTGAGDETLRFWQIFPGPRSDGKDNAGGLLFPSTIGSVIR